MKKNNLRKTNQKGITLIALVITIIVLLILAGVSISMITGQNSIMEKAQDAVVKTKNAEELEKVQLAVVNAMAESDLGVLEQEKLNIELGKLGFGATTENAAPWTVTGVQGSYTISKSGSVEPHYTNGGTTPAGGGSSTPPTVASKKPATANGAVTILSQTEITTLQDANGKIVKVPAKFGIAYDSATVVADGIVIEDASGNQFVWIPVDDISNYKRTAFKGENITSTFTESMPSDEQTSVNTNKGYYIGRFEAGDSVTGYTEDSSKNSLRTSSSGTTNAISIKKGCAPYNYISKSDAETKAAAMKTEQSYTATTKLCSSYAWDTAINFIQSKGGDLVNYGSSSPQGNYYDVAKSYKDITGATQTVASGTDAGVIPTGQTTAVCNIYDMGGNVWEWTSEACSYGYAPCAKRGGFCGNDYGYYPAGDRYDDDGSDHDIVGFRVTLYL